MAMICEITMHRTMIFRLVTTFHSACLMGPLLQLVGGVFDEGQAIALAIATTRERTTIRTMSYKSVTTFNTPGERDLPRG